MTTPFRYKFGRNKSKPADIARRLMFARYKLPTMPAAPTTCDYGTKVGAWGMLGNDTVGDCVPAALAHGDMGWTANGAGLFVPTTAQVLADYSAVTGFDVTQTQPDGSNPTDEGTDPETYLKYARATGISGAHKVGAWVGIDPTNMAEMMQAAYILEGVYIAVDLPIASQAMTDVWDVPPGQPLTGDWAPGSLGGHMIWGIGYRQDWGMTIVTWGQEVTATWAFLGAYGDRTACYAIVAPDELGDNSLTPLGLDMPTLLADLQTISQIAA